MQKKKWSSRKQNATRPFQDSHRLPLESCYVESLRFNARSLVANGQMHELLLYELLQVCVLRYVHAQYRYSSTSSTVLYSRYYDLERPFRGDQSSRPAAPG